MSDSGPIENDFLSQLTVVIEKNISNELFGVSELADEMNMSRSNLLRKVKKETKLSVSQLISQVRLKRAMEMLRKSSLSVSEVSHQVGFNSTSYFIKCFREYYGFPPGEVGKRSATEIDPLPVDRFKWNRTFIVLGSVGLIVALVVGALMYNTLPSSGLLSMEKSIVVLPFKNESNDSTNVYLINGLMESTLNNLQQIRDVKVTSRTSAEKYRNTTKSIPEMAKELNANYFVEGSGQKIGDNILLNIQLIEGSTDRHLWAKQYRRETKDIFELQQEIAKNIANEIQAVITPEEEKRIEKNPTDNVVAYDFFLKGKDLFYKSTRESLEKSIPYFKNAIELDNKFALAYAYGVMVYYYLDIFHVEKNYGAEISDYANKAMSFDAKSGESLIAKGLAHAYNKEYELAIPYFEKALEYDPDFGLVIHFLTEFYHMHVPNTAKYLEYAMEGVRLEIPSTDSGTTSFKYFHLSNALIQAGLFDEASKTLDTSLKYNPDNQFSQSLNLLLTYVKSKDLNQVKELLIKELNKDPMRFDIVQELGKICYILRDYECAYPYYKKLIELRATLKLAIYEEENLKIGIVYSKMGFKKESEELIKGFKRHVDNDRSIYKNLKLAIYYSHLGNSQKSIEHLKLFSKEDNYQYIVLLLPMDPVMDTVKDLPEFKKVMSDIETKFWDTNKELKVKLDAKGLL